MHVRTSRPYELQDYDPAWKEIFPQTAEKITPILGDNLISVEHIGSTSVEGMVAKPQVDVLAVVRDLDRVKDTYEAFTAAGYTPRGREYVGNGDEYVTEDAPDKRRLVSIHIFEEGNPKIPEYRNFRDYLKKHPEDRDLYIATKRNLYEQFRDDFSAYDLGKKEVITGIKERAKAWAESGGQE